MTCERWACSSLGWFRYWMQIIPGAGHELQSGGWPLTNRWQLIGDFDAARTEGYELLRR